jgi:hypothetical protein
MRYLFGFLCVCALGMIAPVGCGESGSGDGGAGGTAGSGGMAGSGGQGTIGGPSDQVTCSESSACAVWLLGDSNTVAMGDNFAPIDANHPEYDTVALDGRLQTASRFTNPTKRILGSTGHGGKRGRTIGRRQGLEDSTSQSC